jgi:hypothetical protein
MLHGAAVAFWQPLKLLGNFLQYATQKKGVFLANSPVISVCCEGSLAGF